MNRRAGFTLVETAVALVVISLLVLIGFPKLSSAMDRNNVRSARTTVVNLIAKARAASTATNRRTWLKVEGGRAWVVAVPRISAGAGTVDTIGIVEDVGSQYGVSISATDSIGFDPRGIAYSLAGASVGFTIAKHDYTDVVTVDAMGRVIK